MNEKLLLSGNVTETGISQYLAKFFNCTVTSANEGGQPGGIYLAYSETKGDFSVAITVSGSAAQSELLKWQLPSALAKHLGSAVLYRLPQPVDECAYGLVNAKGKAFYVNLDESTMQIDPNSITGVEAVGSNKDFPEILDQIGDYALITGAKENFYTVFNSKSDALIVIDATPAEYQYLFDAMKLLGVKVAASIEEIRNAAR